MLETGKDIRARYDRLLNDRLTFEDTWQQISNHILGLRDFQYIREPGETRMARIYDTTGLLSGHLLAGGLQGIATNPQASWHELAVDQPALMADPEVAAFIAIANELMTDVFTKGEFGFVQAAAEFYLDLVFFGTGIFYVEDVPGEGPRFYSRSLNEITVDEGIDGSIDTVFRCHRMTVRNFIEEFGEGHDDDIDRNMEKDPDKEVKVLHLTHPRKQVKGELANDARPWRSVHILYDYSKIVRESGYWTNPWQVARWSKENHEKYGRGPAWVALSDCKMLNEMSKTLIKAAQKAIDPPLLIPDDGVLGSIKTMPGGMNVYRAGMFDQDPIRPLQTAQDPVITENIISQRQLMVKNAFHSQLLQMFEDPRMTATQVLELANQAQRLMAPMLGRIQVEWLEPMGKRALDIGLRGGYLPPFPQLMKQNGAQLVFRYISPVMRAQKQGEARAIMNLWAAAGQIASARPDIFDNLDPDTSLKLIAESEAVPMEVMVADSVVQQIRAVREQQQQQEQQMQQQMQAAEAAGRVLPGVAAMRKADQQVQ